MSATPLRRLVEAALAQALERARPAIEKAESSGWRYRDIHDDVMCARDEHGCGCLCHAAAAILDAYRAADPDPLAELERKAAIGEAVERLHDITEIDYDSSADGHEWYVLTGMRGGVGTTLDAAIAAALEQDDD